MSIPGKCLLAVSSFTMIFLQSLAQDQAEKSVFINPTGTYILKGKKSGKEIRGNFAEIRVKLLDHQTIALSSYFNRGYPEYSSEAFLDTLPYTFNTSSFIHDVDPYCKIVFRFTNADVELLYVFPDNGHNCVFSNSTIAVGKIDKSYDAVPIIVELDRESAVGS